MLTSVNQFEESIERSEELFVLLQLEVKNALLKVAEQQLLWLCCCLHHCYLVVS